MLRGRLLPQQGIWICARPMLVDHCSQWLTPPDTEPMRHKNSGHKLAVEPTIIHGQPDCYSMKITAPSEKARGLLMCQETLNPGLDLGR